VCGSRKKTHSILEVPVLETILPVSSTLTLVATTLGVALTLHVALRWWAHRWTRRQRARRAALGRGDMFPMSWLVRGLHEASTPLTALIWIHALYISASVMLDRTPADGEWAGLLSWVYRPTLVLAMFWLLFRVGRVVDDYLSTLASRTAASWDDLLLPLAGKAVRRGLPVLAFMLGAPAFSQTPALAEILQNATSLILIAIIAMILVEAVGVSTTFVLARYRLDVRNNLQARAVHTQVLVLKKVALTIIGVFTLASMLMVFDSVRQFGASILASAGIASIVIGLAAQRTLATLLAGFQIALTQPIRVDDVVIVENEWGRIEDVTLTYVVVRIWDERRLVVPITYFIEQPFQNWTRSSSEILGTVFLHVDYTAPIDALRTEFTRILQASRNWDGKVNVLQVTDAKEQTLQIRALASAADSSRAWDLRCEVREQLVTFLQRVRPDALPRIRAAFVDVELAGETAAPHAAARTVSRV
jgi:small-conductance mechanosensitive channel